MTDRFYTQENILDLIREVFPIRVLKNSKGEHICQLQFIVPGLDGFQILSTKVKVDEENGYDLYDQLFALLYRASEVIKNGVENTNGVMQITNGDDPIEMLKEMTK